MRKSHKLLAVVMWLGSAQANADTPRTLKNGRPACGNTMGKSGSRKGSVACHAEKALYDATVDLVDAQDELARRKAIEIARINTYITTPRRLANGAPACGNVMGKGDEPECTAERADFEDAGRSFQMKEAIAETASARLRVHEVAQRVTMRRIESEEASERSGKVALR